MVKKKPPRYCLAQCPDCGMDFTEHAGVRVVCSDGDFVTKLSEDGVLLVEDKKLASVLAPECHGCKFDLYGYENDNPTVKPLKLTFTGMVNLFNFPPSDLSEIARKLARHAAERAHGPLANQVDYDLEVEVEKYLVSLGKMMHEWVKAVQAKVHPKEGKKGGKK